MVSATLSAEWSELVEQLRRLPEEHLLAAWKVNSDALAAIRGASAEAFRRMHRLHQRHYAFRVVAIERFGVTGHVARYRALAAGEPVRPKERAAAPTAGMFDPPPLTPAAAAAVVADLLGRNQRIDVAALANELLEGAARLRHDHPVAASNGEILAAALLATMPRAAL